MKQPNSLVVVNDAVVVAVVVTGAAVVTGVVTAVDVVVTVVAGVVGVVTVVSVTGAAVVVAVVELAFKPEVRPAAVTLVGVAELFNQQALAVLTKVHA